MAVNLVGQRCELVYCNMLTYMTYDPNFQHHVFDHVLDHGTNVHVCTALTIRCT
jgi:hypothetical protein